MMGRTWEDERMAGILIMGPYKPLRTWVDEFIHYYMEISWELIDPSTHIFVVGFEDHQEFQVPKMEVLKPYKAIFGGGFSLT